MAVPKIREELEALTPAVAAPRPTAELDGRAAQPSPVRALHERLERHTLAVAAHDVERWSPRRSLALIVTASATLWLAILAAGAGVVHAIA